MNILIIEDEESIRQVLRELLEINGHTVSEAADGAAGVDLAARRPDLILCDINMPKMDGYQTIEAIQRTPQCRDIPFIFLTAIADRSAQRRGMELGAADYITKPFTEQDIVNAIAASIRRQQPLRERIATLIADRHHEAGANWAHELMTPLNGVLGGLELIEAEADTIPPGELKELLGIIRAGAEQQHALSKKLMLHYELERLKITLATAPASSDAPTSIKIGSGEAATTAKRTADLVVRCDSGTVPLASTHLRAAIRELIANAFFFSKPGQPVVVTGTQSDGRYHITIVDQGAGMTAEQCAQAGAFKQFNRNEHHQDGLGLGLGIARSVAEIAGGQLTLQPGPDGRGLQASLNLPCA